MYVGYTKNLKERFDSHQEGDVESTEKRMPLKLIYYEACLSQKDAMRREIYLKSRNGRAFLKRRIKSYVTG
jgi:putative endonuclease